VFHSCGSVDQAWSVFIDIVQEGIRKFVPHCKPSSRRTIFSTATRKLIYAKHKCYRRLKYSVSLDMTTAVLEQQKANLRSAGCLVQAAIRKENRDFETRFNLWQPAALLVLR